MTILFKPRHLKRYARMARLYWKHGRSDMFQTNAFTDLNGNGSTVPDGKRSLPEELANDLEAMGPTFIKLGQVLSSRPDLMPEPYLKALSRLQDDVKPFSFQQVESIVQTELGVRLSKAFSFFDPAPLAAASLGQVHRATLRDGRDVVVKVQRPGIRQQIAEDFEAIEELVDFLKRHTKLARRYQFHKVLEEFQRTLLHELDYLREAGNLRTIGENLKDFPRIRVPQPIADYTTRAVLTMEHIDGQKITSLTPLARTELDGAALADELFKAYLKQVLVDGVFHADPHPGNVYLTHEKEIALLDLGMVGHVAPVMQEKLIRLLIALSDGRSEEAANFSIQISETTSEFNEADFRRQIAIVVAEQKDNNLAEIEVGKTVLRVSRSAADNGLFVPSELTLLGKTLMQLDQVGLTLDPKFNPNTAVRQNVADILNQRMARSLTAGKVMASVLEMKDFIGGLPPKVNKILDAVGDAKLQIQLRPRDTNFLLFGVQKIANRITAGLILSALIVGAAMLMQVETRFRLFGYPGLAIICFIGAALGGLILLLNILFQDRRSKRAPSRDLR